MDMHNKPDPSAFKSPKPEIEREKMVWKLNGIKETDGYNGPHGQKSVAKH